MELLLDANYLQLNLRLHKFSFVRRRVFRLLIPLVLAWGSLLWAAPEKPLVVSSFTVIQDWTQIIGDKHFEVFNLVPSRSETHGFQLGPRHVKELRRAALIIAMSPSLEPWLDDWIKANDRSSQVLWLHPEADPKDSHDLEGDPHVWTSPKKAKFMVRRIAERLTRLQPGINLEVVTEQYFKEISALDGELAALFKSLPTNKRSFISQHPNLGHFAQHFGLRVAGTILTNGSGEAADPSARHFSELLAIVKKDDLRLVVTDTDQNDAIARRLTQDSQLPPPLPLAFEYLSPAGQPGDTWITMMRSNGRKLHAALRDR